MHAFGAGKRDAATVEALREAVRAGWAPPVASAAEAAALARFVAAAAGDGGFLLSLGGGVVRLGDLARAAGAQGEAAAAILPHLVELVAARPQLLDALVGLLSGAVPVSALPPLPVAPDLLRRALGEAGAGTEPPDDDPLLAAIMEGRREAVVAAIGSALAAGSVAPLVERLRPWTPRLAPLAIGAARGLPPSDDALRLAIVLGDEEAARAIATADPDLAAAAAWAGGDRVPLARLYAGWAAADGVAARTFAGGDLPAMMEAFADPAGTPGTRDLLVSVVMTARDPEPALLTRAIGSLLAQSHARWELLLVDDGSADASAIAAEAARDPRIRLLAADRNGGPYRARNLALDHARGQAIAIHDADDAAHPERLRVQLDRLAEGGLACVMSRALRFDIDGRIHLEADGAVTGAGTMTALYDRAVFSRIGRFAEVRSRGDVEFLDRIGRTLRADRIATIPCPLMLCRAAPDTLSHRTRRSGAGALRLFRRAYTQRRWWQEDGRWVGAGRLTLPWGLQP